MSCRLAMFNKEYLHAFYSSFGFDIHYMEIDELFVTTNYCQKKFELEETAWDAAMVFAELNRGKYVNIYVVYSFNKLAVPDVDTKKILNFEYLLWEKKGAKLPF